MRLGAIVVDLAVIGPTRWEWLERLCGALPELGVVVCTGSSTVAQRVRGLRLGADDWLTKPCHPEELIARVESWCAGAGAERRGRESPLLAGEVEIQRDQYQAFVEGISIDLTRREFELIELLAASEGRVLEREFIYQRLWGYAMVRGDRSVDVFVRKLRQKLETVSPDWRYIHTHFGIGYRFAAEPANGHRGQRRPAGARSGDPRIRATATSSTSRGRSNATSSPPRIAAIPPFFISIRADVSAATSPERSGSCPTSSTAGTPAVPASSSAASSASKPPARGACTIGSPPISAHTIRAVSRARTRGLVKTRSKLTPMRANARPAARACCSPRAVSRRSKSGPLPCGSASACRSSQSIPATAASL